MGIYDIISFNNKRWLLKRKMKDDNINESVIKLLKEYNQSDLVLKKDGYLFFVEEIPVANFEEIK